MTAINAGPPVPLGLVSVKLEIELPAVVEPGCKVRPPERVRVLPLTPLMVPAMPLLPAPLTVTRPGIVPVPDKMPAFPAP